MGQANVSGELLPAIFGNLDENIIKIEKAFGVNIVNRGGKLAIVGENAEFAQEIVRQLLHIADRG